MNDDSENYNQPKEIIIEKIVEVFKEVIVYVDVIKEIEKEVKVTEYVDREVIKEIDLHALTGDADTCLACEG